MFHNPEVLQQLVADRHREALRLAQDGRWRHERRQVQRGRRRRGQ